MYNHTSLKMAESNTSASSAKHHEMDGDDQDKKDQDLAELPLGSP